MIFHVARNFRALTVPLLLCLPFISGCNGDKNLGSSLLQPPSTSGASTTSTTPVSTTPDSVAVQPGSPAPQPSPTAGAVVTYMQAVQSVTTQLSAQPTYQISSGDMAVLQTAGVLQDGDTQALNSFVSN